MRGQGRGDGEAGLSQPKPTAPGDTNCFCPTAIYTTEESAVYGRKMLVPGPEQQLSESVRDSCVRFVGSRGTLRETSLSGVAGVLALPAFVSFTLKEQDAQMTEPLLHCGTG